MMNGGGGDRVGAARQGVVVKDGAALEAMADTRTVLFDKTGTLTSGRARLVTVVTPPGGDPGHVLGLAASVEQASPHVIAGALVTEALARRLPLSEPTGVSERAGSVVLGAAMPAVWRTPSAGALALLAAAGALGLVAHLSLVHALTALPASTLAPLGYVRLAWALAIGAAAFGDFPDALALAGGAVIVAAGVYVVRQGVAAAAPGVGD